MAVSPDWCVFRCETMDGGGFAGVMSTTRCPSHATHAINLEDVRPHSATETASRNIEGGSPYFSKDEFIATRWRCPRVGIVETPIPALAVDVAMLSCLPRNIIPTPNRSNLTSSLYGTRG